MERCGKDVLSIDEAFPLEVRNFPAQLSRALHTHEFSELVVITHGSGVHLTANGEYRIEAGDVFVIPPNMFHGYRVERQGRFSLVNVMFRFDGLRLPYFDLRKSPGFRVLFELEPEAGSSGSRVLSSERHLSMDRPTLENVIGLLTRLESALSDHRPGWRFRAVGMFMELVSFLSDHFSAFPLEAPEHHDLMCLCRVLDFMEKHYVEELYIPDLARMAAMSESKFYRVFTALMGMSAEKYIADLRISHAEMLLRKTELAISEIAARSGFSDSNYFTRMFHRKTGVSPRAYRGGSRSASRPAAEKQ